MRELENASEFIARHIGIDAADEAVMLKTVAAASRAALIEEIVPASIARSQPMAIPRTHHRGGRAGRAQGHGGQEQGAQKLYRPGILRHPHPGVILRNILENPAWYTAYTPYQAEISQGRMEALINFQTMVMDLTGMPMANASMLDEATAAAEAMTMALRASKIQIDHFLVDAEVLPQTLAVIQTRAEPLGISVKVCQNSDELAQDSLPRCCNTPAPAAWCVMTAP